jgi:hypothetical protein
VTRNTFGRILTLLVALGTGITTPANSPKQRALIIFLSILYFCANLAYLVAAYVHKTQTLSFTIAISVSLALSATNTIFFIWILKALGETKKKLSENSQLVKYTMMQRFTSMLFFVYLAGALAVFGDIYLKTEASRTELWRHEWWVEAAWHAIFACFLVMVGSLMRPSERSKLLAYVEEIGPEHTGG